MASKKPSIYTKVSASREEIAARVAFRASGAAGIHIDQKARKHAAAGRTNRIGSRSRRNRVAARDGW